MRALVAARCNCARVTAWSSSSDTLRSPHWTSEIYAGGVGSFAPLWLRNGLRQGHCVAAYWFGLAMLACLDLVLVVKGRRRVAREWAGVGVGIGYDVWPWGISAGPAGRRRPFGVAVERCEGSGVVDGGDIVGVMRCEGSGVVDRGDIVGVMRCEGSGVVDGGDIVGVMRCEVWMGMILANLADLINISVREQSVNQSYMAHSRVARNQLTFRDMFTSIPDFSRLTRSICGFMFRPNVAFWEETRRFQRLLNNIGLRKHRANIGELSKHAGKTEQSSPACSAKLCHTFPR